jgi:hypothetical protein
MSAISAASRAEETLTVALEQADALNELESNRSGNYGDMAGDPFGVSGNTAFTERASPPAGATVRAMVTASTRP